MTMMTAKQVIAGLRDKIEEFKAERSNLTNDLMDAERKIEDVTTKAKEIREAQRGDYYMEDCALAMDELLKILEVPE